MKSGNYKLKEIVDISYEELSEIADFYVETYGKPPWEEDLDKESVIEYFNNFIEDKNIFLTYSNEDNIVLAVALLIPISSYRTNYLRIEDFCVDSNYKNQGIGSRFIDDIEAYFDPEYFDLLILNTIRTFPSEKFYLKNSFQTMESSITMFKKIN